MRPQPRTELHPTWCAFCSKKHWRAGKGTDPDDTRDRKEVSPSKWHGLDLPARLNLVGQVLVQRQNLPSKFRKRHEVESRKAAEGETGRTCNSNLCRTKVR